MASISSSVLPVSHKLTNFGSVMKKTSSSKKISLKEKLKQAKEKLQELYIQFPYLNPDTNESAMKAQELNTSFQEIINLANIV